MTRNDFEILARHLRAMYPRNPKGTRDGDYRDGYIAAINQVIGACSAVNSRFDAAKFKAACGIS